jgi:hypothetical protein
MREIGEIELAIQGGTEKIESLGNARSSGFLIQVLTRTDNRRGGRSRRVHA